VKKLLALLGVALIGLVAWIAAAPPAADDNATDVAIRRDIPRAMGAPPAPPSASSTSVGGPDLSGEPLDAPPPEVALEPPVPPEVIAPIATETAPPPNAANDKANEIPSMRDPDTPRPMIIPVAGVGRSAMRDMFNETRGNRRHEAIDILAPRGTPVIATDDGEVKKLFSSKPGGLTVYQFDPDQRFCYYYAHLDRYAPGLHEGQVLRRGEVLGYVGTTGNAPKNTPHLHFALIRLDKERRWWKGTYVNPYPMLTR
jgi:peptidoglycan LD-endopeptidase LytH